MGNEASAGQEGVPGSQESAGSGGAPDEFKNRQVKRLDDELKLKFAKGAQYNMRIVIKGDRGSGKSCLFERLQGKPFPAKSPPTQEIQIAHIHWDYRVTEDIVKVDVWDVVDKSEGGDEPFASDDPVTIRLEAVKKVLDDAIKSKGSHSVAKLDASQVNVLKGAAAVIFLFDPRKLSGWHYIKRELPKVPKNIDVLVLANFRDLGVSDIKITSQEYTQWLKLQGDNVRFWESSMVDGYGLKAVKTFLNLPYLKIKKEGLEAQLRKVTEDYTIAVDEVNVLSREQSYEAYIKWLQNRATAAPNSPILQSKSPPSEDGSSSPTLLQDVLKSNRSTGNLNKQPSAGSLPGSPRSSPRPSITITQPVNARKQANPGGVTAPPSSLASNLSVNSPVSQSSTPNLLQGILDSASGSSTPNKSNDAVVNDLRKIVGEAKQTKSAPKTNVDDFVPDSTGDIDDFFSFEDQKSPPTNANEDLNDNSEDLGEKNPLIMEDEEDIETPSYVAPPPQLKPPPEPVKPVSMVNFDDEEPAVVETPKKEIITPVKQPSDSDLGKDTSAELKTKEQSRPTAGSPAEIANKATSNGGGSNKTSPVAQTKSPALPPKAIPKKTVASDYDSFFGDGASTAEPEVLDNEDDLWGSGDSKDDADTSSPKSSNKDVFEEDWDINASQDTDSDILKPKKYPTPGQRPDPNSQPPTARGSNPRGRGTPRGAPRGRGGPRGRGPGQRGRGAPRARGSAPTGRGSASSTKPAQSQGGDYETL